jgi:ABC-2 type transport system ATP-binding protein
MIEVEELGKSYGPIKALHDVSFHLSAGEIVGLLGPNGAGKTTIMKILTGYLQPDEGTVIVDDINVLSHPRLVQERIGYLPENAPLYPELTVQSYLMMMADLRQIPEDRVLAWISEAVFSAGLEGSISRPIGHLSKGLRQRVGIAQAILHKPKLLILDEPTIGLDPTQVVEVRQLIRRLAKRSTVLFSTHILSEVEALCDRVIILINGQVREDARLSELASSNDAIQVLEEKKEAVEAILQELELVGEVSLSESSEGYPVYRIAGIGEQADRLCPAIYDLAREHAWPVRELQREVRTLESVFNALATSE